MSLIHRASPRIDKLFFISFIETENSEQKSPVSIGRTLNISSTGLGIEAFLQIHVGATMEMNICLGDEILAARGKVVHSRPLESGGYFLGIEFDTVQERLASAALQKESDAVPSKPSP
jgi:hypothetical protein